MKRQILLYVVLFMLTVSCSSETQIFDKSSDVGNPKMKGSFTYDKVNDMYILTGGGYDMWFERDEFFVVWKEVTGDFKLSAELAFEGEGSHELRKMGLIISEALEEDARHANVALHGNALVALQYRLEKGGETKEIRASYLLPIQLSYEDLFPQELEEKQITPTPFRLKPTKMPDHLILERMGNKIIMKTGIDSFSDQPDAILEIVLPPKCYVGLFMCSHEVDLLETGYFWNVRLE